MTPTPNERFSIEAMPDWAFQPDLTALLEKNRKTNSTNLHFQQEQHCPSRGFFVRNIYCTPSNPGFRQQSNVRVEKAIS